MTTERGGEDIIPLLPGETIVINGVEGGEGEEEEKEKG